MFFLVKGAFSYKNQHQKGAFSYKFSSQKGAFSVKSLSKGYILKKFLRNSSLVTKPYNKLRINALQCDEL